MTATDERLAKRLQGEVRARLEERLPAFLARQRWFGGKSRKIDSTSLRTMVALPQSKAVIALVEVRFDDGGTDLYQLPLGIATGESVAALTASAPNAAVAMLAFGGAETLFFDATADPAFRAEFLQVVLSPPAESTELLAHRSPSVDAAALQAADSRVGSAEQSNTSIVFGERAILKLFRRLTAGENPDVEIGRFLGMVAHFDGTPAYFGDLTYAAEGITLGYLQAFAANEGDGWAWMLQGLGDALRAAAAAVPVAGALTAEAVRGAAATTVEAAALLGRRTAAMHLALATPTTDEAFAAEPYTDGSLRADIDRMREQVEQALAALEAAQAALPAALAAKAAALLGARSRILAHIRSLDADPGELGQRIRIHGDYHLGQVLRTTNDFLIVDFEGEPAKPLEARRRKQTPLKDVAGMLRSVNYVAQSALAEAGGSAATAGEYARLWEQVVADEFLQAYRETLAVRAELLPRSSLGDALLLGLLFEKAFYELVYELNNRPAWLYLPLDGLLSLVGRLPDAST